MLINFSNLAEFFSTMQYVECKKSKSAFSLVYFSLPLTNLNGLVWSSSYLIVVRRGIRFSAMLKACKVGV